MKQQTSSCNVPLFKEKKQRRTLAWFAAKKVPRMGGMAAQSLCMWRLIGSCITPPLLARLLTGSVIRRPGRRSRHPDGASTPAGSSGRRRPASSSARGPGLCSCTRGDPGERGAASRLRHPRAFVTLPGQPHGYTGAGRIGDSFPPFGQQGLQRGHEMAFWTSRFLFLCYILHKES